MDDGEPLLSLTLSEWAVLGLLGGSPQHAFALVKTLAPGGDLGRVWVVPTPVVYRAVHQLRDKGLIVAVGDERTDLGPPRTLLTSTPHGEQQLQTWLRTPVEHMRDVRGALLLKLGLLARLKRSPRLLIVAQHRTFTPLIAGLERQVAAADATTFDATLVQWRLESARAVMRFLDGLLAARA